jgi:hypothetical protein
MSFTKLPREVLIVTVSAAGLPQTSQTRIVFSAMTSVLSMGLGHERGSGYAPIALFTRGDVIGGGR